MEIKEPEDIFELEEFKKLPFWRRVWIRLKVAFFISISMH
jgi:hypothetical protein